MVVKMWTVVPEETWTCYFCHRDTPNLYVLDNKWFCGSDHARLYLFKRINRWDDSKVLGICTTNFPFFQDLRYDKRKWSFQLSKILVEVLHGN